MRAAVMTGPGRIAVVEAPDPLPGPGEALVRTVYAGVCGSDLDRVFGSAELMTYPGDPGAPGHEAVGVVVESHDAGLRAGDLVLAVPSAVHARTFADLQVLPASTLIRVEPPMDPRELLLAQQLGTVVYALKHFWPGPAGRSAMVLGTGAAGLQFVQLLKQRGFEHIIASDLSPTRLARARSFGADETVLATDTDVVSAVDDLTSGRGADLVVEAAGRDATRADAMRCVAAEGVVGLYGLPETLEAGRFPFHRVFRRQATIRTRWGAQSEPHHASFRTAIELIRDGSVDIDGLLTHTFDLDDVEQALAVARDRLDDAVKVCLRFDAHP